MTLFSRLLIANRGEIACRILRTAQRLGIHCVAIYSEADAKSLHVQRADSAYCVGKAPSKDSYLNIDAILEIAERAQVDAIHPGYGFLSENAKFARRASAAGFKFVGPSADIIQRMGNKDEAKRIMAQAKIPVIPGYHETDQSLKGLTKACKTLGFPLLIKAAAGGGGKGMRIVHTEAEMENAIESAKREALASFGDDRLILEKHLDPARHIEVQLLADSHGHILHLGTRDCSLQRRHQKIIEEAPAPFLNASLTESIEETALEVARILGYVNAGTVEFLLDSQRHFYFMEMNTRLQVEHPVTEMVVQQDLVEWQLRIAAGEKLTLTQEDCKIKGHSIEARIYAEDPENAFMPSTGRLEFLLNPDETAQIRLDSGVQTGDIVTHFYDPMLAKLIVWDKDRTVALKKLEHALSHYQMIGVANNIDFLKALCLNTDVLHGHTHVKWIETYLNQLLNSTKLTPTAIAGAYLGAQQTHINFDSIQHTPWYRHRYWRSNLPHEKKLCFRYREALIEIFFNASKENCYDFVWKDTHYKFVAEYKNPHQWKIRWLSPYPKVCEISLGIENAKIHVFTDDEHFVLHYEDPFQAYEMETHHPSELSAPMPGIVSAVLVKNGDKVAPGDPLLVMEAMKMEHTIKAPSAGIIKNILFSVGETVSEGVELVELFTEENLT